MTYYERWMHSIAQTLIQRGVISIDELGRKMAEVEARAAAGRAVTHCGDQRAFRPGDRVTVRAA